MKAPRGNGKSKLMITRKSSPHQKNAPFAKPKGNANPPLGFCKKKGKLSPDDDADLEVAKTLVPSGCWEKMTTDGVGGHATINPVTT